MPYSSNDELPDAVKKAYPSDACRSVFRKAFNGADGSEASRFKIAHSAAQKCGAAKDGTMPDKFETKAFDPHDLELKEDGSVVVAFAKTDATDSDGDYTFPGAFEAKDVPISAYSHASWPQKGGLLPVGRGTISERDGWAILEGKFFDTQGGRDTRIVVKEMGDLQQWSYGYRVLSTAPPPAGTKAARGLKSLDVREISPVLVGAQSLAHTVGIKSASDLVSEAGYALGTILRLAQREAAGAAADAGQAGADAAEDTADRDMLVDIAQRLNRYIAATLLEVGTPDDLADIMSENAARMADMARYASADSFIAELKGGSPAGQPYVEMSGRVLTGVTQFVERTKAIQDLRLKEGRAISAARLALLEEHLTGLNAAAKTLGEMIAEARPKKDDVPAAKSAQSRAIEAQFRMRELAIA